MTKIEEIAFAMFEDTVVDGAHSQWETAEESQRQIYISNARAAIKALMGPSDDAISAGGWHFAAEADELPQDDHHDAKAAECFTAMLQAILDEEVETCIRNATAKREVNDGPAE